jgi:two-component system, LytTR family, response regulator
MDKIRTLVIEDSKPNREVLLEILRKYFPEVLVLHTADNAYSAYHALCQHDYDLVLTDIELPRDTIFEVFKKLKKIEKFPFKFETIFITSKGSNRDYWTNAMKVSAVDFLDKPIELDQLREAIENAKARLLAKKSGSSISVLFDNLEAESKNRKFAIHLLRGQLEYIRLGDILYFEADETVTIVHSKNGNWYKAMKNLGYYAKLLQDDKTFYRIAADKLINCDAVISFDSKNRMAVISEDLKLEVSRRNVTDFKKHMESLRGKVDLLARLKGLLGM